jgi:hypothetical protein
MIVLQMFETFLLTDGCGVSDSGVYLSILPNVFLFQLVDGDIFVIMCYYIKSIFMVYNTI